MSAAVDSLHGRVLAGRYQLGTFLGGGIDAVVYEAVDLQLERQVAVKLLTAPGTDSPSFQRRFHDYAQAVSQLTHAYIVPVHDWGREDLGLGGHPFLVTELVTGGSLRAIVDRGRRLSPSQALLVGLDVCRGLDHAHRRGFVHGDVKPSNILFGADRRARITDFGLAGLIARSTHRRAADLDLANARYASPEQAQDLDVDRTSDVYSLSLTLIEAITGEVPFAAGTTVATLNGRIDKLLPLSADLGPLAAVLEHAGRPDAQDRFSAAELGRALIAVAERLPKPAPLPLATGQPSMFEAPLGRETTSELTRFRDSTGATARPASATGDRPGRAGSDPSGGIPRARVVAVDEQGEATTGEVRRPRTAVLAYLALVVGLVAASAFAVVAYRKLTEKAHDVPSLIGLDEGTARNEVARYDWKIVVRNEPNEEQPQNAVFRTEPPAGATLGEGKELVLFVSAGPPLSTIPEISGLTVEEATAALQQARLRIAMGSEQYSEDVPAGQVISWTVAAQPTLRAGDQVVRDTVLSVVVSQGPQPRTVPDLRGKTFEQAQEVVAPFALGVCCADGPTEFSNDYPAGQIIAQDLAPGQTVERGVTVTVTFSKGPDLVTVPDVIRKTADDVISALEGAGLAVGKVQGDVYGGQLVGISYRQRQVAIGEQLPRGTKVDLIFL